MIRSFQAWEFWNFENFCTTDLWLRQTKTQSSPCWRHSIFGRKRFRSFRAKNSGTWKKLDSQFIELIQFRKMTNYRGEVCGKGYFERDF